MKKGFTLIETIIYIGLFSIIMSGTLVAIYALIENNSKNKTKNMVQEEGSFLINKIDWLLNGLKYISISPDGKKILITDKQGSNNSIEILENNIFINKNNQGLNQLNNTNVSIDCPNQKCFTLKLNSEDNIFPDSLEINLQIYSKTETGAFVVQSFSTTKFLRK